MAMPTAIRSVRLSTYAARVLSDGQSP
jgi:hypothetical protein